MIRKTELYLKVCQCDDDENDFNDDGGDDV